MRRVCFKDLPVTGVDVAVIEAQALNYFSCEPRIESNGQVKFYDSLFLSTDLITNLVKK